MIDHRLAGVPAKEDKANGLTNEDCEENVAVVIHAEEHARKLKLASCVGVNEHMVRHTRGTRR